MKRMDDEGQPTIEERAGAVTDVVLRNARRRQAGEFLAQQARHLDSADVRDEIRPRSRPRPVTRPNRAAGDVPVDHEFTVVYGPRASPDERLGVSRCSLALRDGVVRESRIG